MFSEGSIDEVTRFVALEMGVPVDAVHYGVTSYKKHDHHLFTNGGNEVYTYFAIREGKNNVDDFYAGIFLDHMKSKGMTLIFVDDKDRYEMASLDAKGLKQVADRLLDGRKHRVLLGIEGKDEVQKQQLCMVLYEVCLCLREDIQEPKV